MKKYRVHAVYCGCNCGETITDTYEEALLEQENYINAIIEDFGEENYLKGNGDFCVYIDEIDV